MRLVNVEGVLLVSDQVLDKEGQFWVNIEGVQMLEVRVNGRSKYRKGGPLDGVLVTVRDRGTTVCILKNNNNTQIIPHSLCTDLIQVEN